MLTILYDALCPFCQRCRRWVERQPQLVSCRFLPVDAPDARLLVGGAMPGGGRELVVVREDGAFWVAGDAFLVILWALDDYRWLASTLAIAPLRPLSEHFFGVVSSARPLLSTVFGGGARCEDGHCGAVGVPSRGAYR